MASDEKAFNSNIVRLPQKTLKKFDTITGEKKEVKQPAIDILPRSKMLDTYYDMLTTQKRPFNRTKGAIVTPLVIGVQPC